MKYLAQPNRMAYPDGYLTNLCVFWSDMSIIFNRGQDPHGFAMLIAKPGDLSDTRVVCNCTCNVRDPPPKLMTSLILPPNGFFFFLASHHQHHSSLSHIFLSYHKIEQENKIDIKTFYY